MKKSENSLVEGLERIGLMASSIRKNDGLTPIEIDILLQELRELYVTTLQVGKDDSAEDEVAARKAAEEKKAADEAAARKAVEEKRAAEEAAARKAAEEKKAAEEATARKAAEEKKAAEIAARKAADEKKAAEEAAARKAAEEKRAAEIAARKAAEEKKAAEEAAARKVAEEKKAAEAAARKAAEEKKAAEESARNAAEEVFNPVFAPEEPEKEAEPIMPPMLDNLEGNPNDSLFSDTLNFDEETPKAKPKESLLDYLKKEKAEELPTVRTLADTLNHPSRNIEDQLETKVRSKKVDNLHSIININDKFSFMSELFHNNMKAYNDFIVRLNSIAEREEALACVAEIAEQYNWDADSLVVKNFYKVFDRKF